MGKQERRKEHGAVHAGLDDGGGERTRVRSGTPFPWIPTPRAPLGGWWDRTFLNDLEGGAQGVELLKDKKLIPTQQPGLADHTPLFISNLGQGGGVVPEEGWGLLAAFSC